MKREAMIRFSVFSLLLAALFLCPGCYFHRATRNYKDLVDLPTLEEESGQSKAEREAKRDEELAALLSEYANKEQIFTINAGDVLHIRVYNQPDIVGTTTMVTPDGCIGMVLVGQVRVAGLTLEQATEILEEKLEEYIVNPKVGISPATIHSETATIAGAINKNGMFVINTGMRLTDLYALAGGASVRNYGGEWEDAADLSHSLFVRDGKVLPVDFNRAIRCADPLHNVELRKGDYVYIAPRDDSVVYLLGDVRNPQKIIWNRNMGILELLASCGGPNETYWDHAIVIRGDFSVPELYKVDLGAILQGKRPNVRLRAGDIVYLPHDDISEYNVFIRKLMPTIQLIHSVKDIF